jgi:hypothetical protein
MPGPRILGLVDSCGVCPNRQYYSGSQYKCNKADQLIIDDHRVASFCPLPTYPAGEMANMERTIEVLRNGVRQSFAEHLLAFISSDLKLNIQSESSNIIIPVDEKDGGKVVFDLRNMKTGRNHLIPEFEFFYGDDSYRLTLSVGTRPPQLQKLERVEGTAEPLWRMLTIRH